MDIASDDVAVVVRGRDAPAAGHPHLGRPLLAVVAVGVVVAALTWRMGDAGLGWLAADGVLVVALLGGLGRGRPGGAAWLLGACSVWLAAAPCWYASDWALATAWPASVATLAMLALVTARRLRADRVSDLGGASLSALCALPHGIGDAARLPVRALGSGARAHASGVLRGVLIGVPITLTFTALLAADGRFRHALGRIVTHSGDGIDLALWTGATVAAFLVGYAVLRRVRDVPAAAASPELIAAPYRVEGDAPAALVEPARGPRLRPLTWGVVLAQLVGVFAVYVGANAGSLFAGHAQLRAHGTWTYAGYLHEGFTQVSVATLLAVACVVVGHVLLRPRGGAGPVAGGRRLAALELALLGLVGVTLASCGHRLALYEQAYGYTYLRLGVWVLQLGVAGLLAATAARCVARSWRGWGSALTWAAVAFALVAGSVDADGWIAARNVARARAGLPLDTGYLAGLSEDARAQLPEVAALDADAAAVLDEAWSTQREAHGLGGWRARRGLGAAWR